MGLFESKEKKAARFYALAMRHDGNELEYLQKAIALGSVHAKEGLAKYFFRFYPKDKQIQQQAKVLMEEAEQAGVNIDHAVFAQICEKCGDLTKADAEWEKAMRGSMSAEAQLACGNYMMYRHGKEKDKLLIAEKMLCRAYEDGNHVFFRTLAELYEEIAEYPRAAAMYRKAALDGDSHCMYITGLYYLQGKGVQADPIEAAHWVKRAADKNNRDAMLMLAKMHIQGIGADKHVDEGIAMLEKLAGYNFMPAIEYLAEYFYAKGTDDEKAEKYARVGKYYDNKRCTLIEALLNLYERIPDSYYYWGLETLQKMAEEGDELAVYEWEKWEKYHKETTVDLFERGISENNEELIREAAKHRYPEAAKYLLKKLREKTEQNPRYFTIGDARHAVRWFYICVDEKSALPIDDFLALEHDIGRMALGLVERKNYDEALELVDNKYLKNDFLCLYTKAVAYGHTHVSRELALDYFMDAFRHPEANTEEKSSYKANLTFYWQLSFLSMGETWLKSDKATYYMQEVKKATQN